MSSKVNKIGKRNVGKGSLDYCLNRPSSIYPEKYTNIIKNDFK